MSRENVEIVAAALAAFDRRDREAMVALLDPNVEWQLVYLTFLDSEFKDMRIEHGEYVEAGGKFVVPIRVRATGSGVEGDFSFTSVVTIADGKLVRARNYPTTAEALEAVGRRE